MKEAWISELADRLIGDVEWSIQQWADALKDHVGGPIELMFATSLWGALRLGERDCVLLRDGKNVEEFRALCGKHAFAIALQYPWRRYKSDLCLAGKAIGKPILIECDGHDFHERTKEQAAHDRKKDLLAQQDGYSILRFTGSQIYKDAYGCAADVLNFAAERGRGRE